MRPSLRIIGVKILHAVENYYPSISGSPEVVRHISERLVQRGHDVTVATRKIPERKSLAHNGVKIVEFDINSGSGFGMSIVHGLKGDIKEYQAFLRKGGFDIVMTYAAQQWTTDLMFDVLDDIRAKKVIVPCGYSGLFDPDFREYFQDLQSYLRKFDAAVYMCRDYRDVNFAKQVGLRNSYFIPNGADETEFSEPLSSRRENELKRKYGIKGLVLMTIANYTGEKGHDELLRVFRRLPVPEVTLISAGGNTPHVAFYDPFKQQADRINTRWNFRGKKVVMVDGSQRQEVYDLLKLSDIFVFFSNIECSPLVLFEAAAAGIPFIATHAGNSAEIAEWTGGGIIAKSHEMPNGRVAVDLDDAIKQITKLACNPAKRRAMGKTGHKAWKNNYTWDKITNQYESLYKKLLTK